MKLSKIKIENFRAYREKTEVLFDDLTAIIGKNDMGKSTILEALEIFFNNSVVTCDSDDLCVNSSDNNIRIACTFSDLPENIIIDTTVETNLNSEYLVNEENELEILKIFSVGSSSKPKEKVYINCQHPSEEKLKDLLLLKNSDLKKRAGDLGIEKESYNASINGEIRSAIRCKVATNTLQETLLPADKEEAKKIYDCLKPHLPMFALFQSDRSSTDNDSEITDPMKIAIDQALKEVSDDLEKIKKAVQIKALETATKTLEKLNEMSPYLANSLVPEFKSEPNFNSLFKLMIKSDGGIPINKRGSGVRRLVLLNFFRAEAERRLKNSDNTSIIYAFEEPETSQHPDHQMLLIDSFIELSHASNTQIIITTHTPALASMINTDNLRFVCSGINGEREIRSKDEATIKLISEELGVFPNPISSETKGILLVEGPSDVIFANHTAKCLHSAGYLNSTFEREKIAIVPIGGCGTLKYWVNFKLIEQFKLPWCILLDSDLGAAEETYNSNKVDELRKIGIKAYVTRRREPENYIHYDCIKEDIVFSETDDAKIIINKTTNIAKNEVLIKLWPKMTVNNIRDVEKYNESGIDHYEFTEMFEDFLSLVN